MEVLQAIELPLRELFTGLGGEGAMIIPLILIFVAVFLGALAILYIFSPKDPVERRLAPDSAKSKEKQRADELAEIRLRHQSGDKRWEQILKPLEKHLVPGATDDSSVRLRMLQAGFVGPNVVRNYYLIRTVLAVGLPLGFLVLAPFYSGGMPVQKVMMGAVALGLGGLYLPGIWISSRIDGRADEVRASFPDALDMLVVCVEAGLGLDAAFNRVGSQIAAAHPILAEEFAIVSLELRAGKSREDALRNLAKRVGVPEISSFVTLLIQSDALGTSIAQTLRVHADEMRTKRMLRAEEMAHKLPVKLTIPLVTCILPVMLTVVMLPALITMIRQILPNLGN